ncbi:MAG: DUF2075 domain-containing protein [Syntrophaceae bacterium]|nr:DUF2075 domain-containing protein [Syntrophaceae bacterium]
MRLYEGTIQEFDRDITQNRIADIAQERFRTYYHKSPSESEYRAWQQSLNILNNSFRYSGLKDNKLIVEYELPYSTRRIDVLLFGKDRFDRDSVVLMELKQWSNEHIYDCEAEGNIVVDFHGKKEVAHPCLQVEGYHFDLQDFLLIFREFPPVKLSSCAYCHNYSRLKKDVLFQAKFESAVNKFPLFVKEDVKALGRYLQDRLKNDVGFEVFNRFITSPVRPSKKLLEHTKEMINKQQIFTLIDDQIAAFNAIMHKAKHLAKTKKKSMVIVKGGPGTGKSVIALEVMAELMRQGRVVYHATGSSAFTNTLRNIVGRRAANLFKFFFNFTQHEDNEIEVLICDEAHRIRANSNDFRVPSRFKSHNPQIDDLIRPAKLSIFFIDEHQIVRPKEIGSIALIKQSAKRFGMDDEDMAEFELKTQFRCSGSDAYLQWLDKMLDVRDSDISYFDAKMEFKFFDDPIVLKKEIDKKNQEKENCARLVAGFCWPWSGPNPDGSLVNDVKIGNFAMPWEPKNAFWRWATHRSGMEQVGTVYTAQGFEFDYIGVIFGPDLVYRESEGGWISRPDKSFDSMVTRNNPDLTAHLKSVYRVLLSRAHKGVYIHFMDKETEAFFRSRMQIKRTVAEPEETLYVSDILSNIPSTVDELLYDIPEERKWSEYLPVYSLKAAAGNFGQGMNSEPEGWIKADIGKKINNRLFVAKVVGHSMEPLIPNDSYCVFRWGVQGTRQNKIVLVQHSSISDPDAGGSYTVKKYTSKKRVYEDESWGHESITLLPLNPAYAPINISDSEEGEFMVIAEFICVL